MFFTMAVMTKMFSSSEMIPRIRKTLGEEIKIQSSEETVGVVVAKKKSRDK